MSKKPKGAALVRMAKAAPDAATQSNFTQEAISNALAAHAAAHAANFDPHGRRILNRLKADDPRVLEIFAAVANNEPSKIGSLLVACVEADLLVRKFNKMLDEERGMIARASKLKQNVEDLKQFLAEITRPPAHPLESSFDIPKEQDAAMRESLNEIAALVDLRHRVAGENILRFGATRKSANKQAAVTAAIGWLAAAVEHIAGRPHTLHAATLAEIVLGIGDTVSLDRTRAARRRRQVAGKLA